MNAGLKRRQRAGLSQKMRALAEARRCPKCDRKMAVKVIRADAFTTVKICRWCGDLS